MTILYQKKNDTFRWLVSEWIIIITSSNFSDDFIWFYLGLDIVLFIACILNLFWGWIYTLFYIVYHFFPHGNKGFNNYNNNNDNNNNNNNNNNNYNNNNHHNNYNYNSKNNNNNYNNKNNNNNNNIIIIITIII